jgi:hypothetical protein
MRTCRVLALISAALALASIWSGTASAASPMSLKRDGSVEIAGRKLKCGRARIMLDRRLPNLGVAGPGILALNPRLLGQMPETARLFVFYHECGHHHVGGNELGADCWAVNEGVREGWLDTNGLGQVCKAFGNDPETSTHPSGKRRCRNVNKCYATALAKLPKPQGGTATAAASDAPQDADPDAAPKLLALPTMIRSGRARSAGPSTPATPHRGQGFSAVQ